MKVAIDTYCGFSLSLKAIEMMADLCNKEAINTLKWYNKVSYEDKPLYRHGFSYNGSRHDQALIKTIETLKKKSFGKLAKLKIVEIPDNVEYYISESEGGGETIHEKHRWWR